MRATVFPTAGNAEAARTRERFAVERAGRVVENFEAMNPEFHKPEVLAPAGGWECAKAAVENGADAIYFGVGRFNARVRADNFVADDLPKLMRFLHRRGVRGYVTFNTLIFSDELAEAASELRRIIEAGADAAIVQDVGVARLIREISPDFPVHASTQMTISSASGVRFARELGASLAVLSREVNVRELAAIVARGNADPACALPLELFVHGALCVAYSGQCLTSESLGGRSANRGECAQACRLPYELICDGEKVPLGARRYLLSPRDLCGIEMLPELMRLGVRSLKIEGRLKSPEYVAAITRAYRDCVDRIHSMITDGVPAETLAAFAKQLRERHGYALEMAFSRGLHTGWLRGVNNRELVHARFGKKRGVFLGTVSGFGKDGVFVRLEAPLKSGDGVVFDAGTPEEKEEGGYVYGVEKARGNGEVFVRFARAGIRWERVRRGDRLWKTADPALASEIRETFAGEQPRWARKVNVRVVAEVGAPLRASCDDACGHEVSAEQGDPLVPATNKPATDAWLREQFGRLGGTGYYLDGWEAAISGAPLVPASVANKLRRALVARLDAARENSVKWTILGAKTSTSSVAARAESCGAGPLSGVRTPHGEDGNGLKNLFLNRNEILSKTDTGDLPHWHQDGKLQFVTFRLADSIPRETRERWLAEKEEFLREFPKPWTSETEELYYEKFGTRMESYLDAGYGSCVLVDEEVQKIVADVLKFFDGERYRLHAFVVMPNHVHVLAELSGDFTLPEILKSWKGFSARQINKKLGASGALWQAESFDRLIRSEAHYYRVLEYIEKNARSVPAGRALLFLGAKTSTSSVAARAESCGAGPLSSVRTPHGEDRNVFSPTPALIPVVRELAQLDAALAFGARTIYAEFENPRDYKAAAERAHAVPGAEFWAQPPRVFKQADDEAGILRLVRECGADGFLVRAHEHLYAFAGARLRGDFSLNVANHLTAGHFLRERGLERVTASYDMNLEQLRAMLARVPAPEKIEVTLHQHMPMFHMEHCVFCTFLSEGKDFRDCGRPCEKHVVRLRDRTGLEHLVKADAGCRNTVYNARAQTGAEFFDELRGAGVRFFRVEFVDEAPELVTEILARYRDLLAGKIDGNALWRGLRLESKLGVTRGTLKG